MNLPSRLNEKIKQGIQMTSLRDFKGFIPYITIVFLNAFVDLGHKIIIQNTVFKVWDGETQVILTAIVNALILLPFIVLFSPSGFLSDRFPKHLIIKYGAFAAVLITLLISAAYAMGWFWIAFGLTLLLAIQSALYSPAKYGYISELLGEKHLAQGNSVVQAVTIIAILAGTFIFSLLFEYLIPVKPDTAGSILKTLVPLGGVLVGLSMIEWFISFKLKRQYGGDHTRVFQLKSYCSGQYLRTNISAIRSHTTIWLSIVGLSVFWAVSQVVLATFPAYAKDVLSINNTVIIQGLLACTGFGIMLGSVMAGRLSRDYIEVGLIPVSAAGMTLALFFLPGVDQQITLAALFIVFGIFGGLFIVPLNALIQYTARKEQIGTVLAGNNWMQNIAMFSFLVMTVLFSVLQIHTTILFYLMALVALAGAIYTVKTLPHSLVRLLVSGILRRKYSIKVTGFENLPVRSGVLLLGNHISWIDWAIIQLACPRPVRFVMLRSIYSVWYLKPVLKFFGAIPISAGNSQAALEQVNAYLRDGEVVCLFPEGAISRNGQLGVFKTGYERAVLGVDAIIVPFYLHGLWGSTLSRSKSERLRTNTAKGIKRNIIVAFGQALPLQTKAPVLKQKVFELSSLAWQAHMTGQDPLPLIWLKAAKRQWRKLSIIDSAGTELTQAQTMVRTIMLANTLKSQSTEANIGVLVPTGSTGLITNLAIMLNGKTAVNLNSTSAPKTLLQQLNLAGIKTLCVTSTWLDAQDNGDEQIRNLLTTINILCVDNLIKSGSNVKSLYYRLTAYLLPASWLYRLFGKRVSMDTAAQIILTADPEPKGIVLSHNNLVGNIRQISEVLNAEKDDVVMASLPLSHAMGLTVTGLMPLVEGIPVVCHPDARDVLGIAKAAARYKVSILCGITDQLSLYADNDDIQPLMLASLRLVMVGGGRLEASTREAFERKFRVMILEGYGCAETAPVASVNIPDKLDPVSWKPQVGQKPGTVGMPLPGTCFRVVDPDTWATLPFGEAGLLLITGIQVMTGYLEQLQVTADTLIDLDGYRWVQTGDRGIMDEDGFITWLGRYNPDKD